MKKRKTTTFLKQKSYLLAMTLMLAAVFGMTGVYVSEQRQEKIAEENRKAQLQQEREEEIMDTAEAQESTKAVDKVILPKQQQLTENTDFLDNPEVISTKDEQSVEEEDTQKQPEESTAQETTAAAQPQLHFDAAEEMMWPIKGNVILNYSMDQTVYFATLDQYKYNPALIIQGNVNDKVYAVADGTVTSIDTNEVTGKTVTVDLGDGYAAVYGQLKEVAYEVGDYMEAGAILGYISEPTKYFSVEGSNLYFQLTKDEQSVDPMEYLQ